MPTGRLTQMVEDGLAFGQEEGYDAKDTRKILYEHLYGRSGNRDDDKTMAEIMERKFHPERRDWEDAKNILIQSAKPTSNGITSQQLDDRKKIMGSKAWNDKFNKNHKQAQNRYMETFKPE